MEIKKLAKHHIADVYKIETVCFKNPWSFADLEKQTELETSHFLVATENKNHEGENQSETVVGYIGLQIFCGEGYITNVAVLPEYRRRGIAAKLLREAEKNKMDFITLEVRESNIAAIRLYEKAGFEHMGIRPNFYDNPTENAVIMTKHIV